MQQLDCRSYFFACAAVFGRAALGATLPLERVSVRRARVHNQVHLFLPCYQQLGLGVCLCAVLL